ncbi:MAG: OmpA family protein [Alphaproteobacteria bacterium]|nr:OmpA family protein [Alphaproteobacteria bacterium]
MKKALVLASVAGLLVMPSAARAQPLQYQGLYISGEGGANWMLNTMLNNTRRNELVYPRTGWVAGGSIGYDLLGPRFEVEGVYRSNNGTVQSLATPTNPTRGFNTQQTAIMANGFYDFNAGGMFVPYVGAGLGVAFVNASAGAGQTSSTNFAYQGIIGVGWNINPMFRLNLDGRYYGTTSPSVNNPFVSGVTYNNNNFTLMASLAFRFGAPSEAPPPPPPATVAPPSFMVFFDWDRSNLSQQALSTIQQAANAFKAKGNARITATGHTDTSGPEAYNMALSLRRANAVKDALVREGVPATAISVVGKGETQPLVQTADGVREPQNRRVEIVLQ